MLPSSSRRGLKLSFRWNNIKPIGVTRSSGVFRHSGTCIVDHWMSCLVTWLLQSIKKEKRKKKKRSLRSQCRLHFKQKEPATGFSHPLNPKVSTTFSALHTFYLIQHYGLLPRSFILNLIGRSGMEAFQGQRNGCPQFTGISSTECEDPSSASGGITSQSDIRTQALQCPDSNYWTVPFQKQQIPRHL